MFDCKFIGFDAMKGSLAKKQKKLKERQRLNAQAVVIVDRWIQKNFQSEGGPQGGWEPLKTSTIKGRKRGGDRILQDTGILKSRWKHLYTPEKAAVMSAAVMSGVDYGVYHDSDKPRKKLPHRKILPREKQIMPLLLKIYKKFIGMTLK